MSNGAGGPDGVERDILDEVVASMMDSCRRGEDLRLDELAERHPRLKDRLQSMASVLGTLSGGHAGSKDSSARPAGCPTELGEYRIVQEVGRGGMGIVYEAEQVALGRRVALKVLPFHSLFDLTQLERFRQEARAAARLHHTNIVPVYGVGEHDGVHYYAMQFIDGRGLDRIILEMARERLPGAPASGPLDATTLTGAASPTVELDRSVSTSFYGMEGVERGAEPDSRSLVAASTGGSGRRDSTWEYSRAVARIGTQVADALAHAHGEGILHRDIKPSNLILDTRGNVWVTDLGLAKDAGAANLTHTGDVVGTLAYMAPERFEGLCDVRSDIYSLGLTLYELLTLRPAFNDSDPRKLVRKVTEVEPTPPRKIDARMPRDLETIILKAMAKDPADRYATAEALSEDLRHFMDDKPIGARRTTVPERVWRWCRRKPALAGLILLLALAGLTVMALTWQYRHARVELERVETEAEAEKLFSTAQRFQAEGRYNDALHFVDGVLERTPDSTSARLLRSRLLLEVEEIDAALEELEALVTDEPAMGETHYLLARIYRGRDDARARLHEETAGRLLADTAEGYHLRSLTASSWEESIQLLNRGLQLEPLHFDCLRSRAHALYAIKDLAAAERDAYLALGLRPLDTGSWMLRALVRRARGRLEEALEDHQRAIELSPDDPEAYNQRRWTCHLLERHKEALADARTCLRLEPGSFYYGLNLLNAFLYLKDFDAVRQQYEALVSSRPDERDTIVAWLQKQVSDRMASGDSLDDLPGEAEGMPFSIMQIARAFCQSLARRATRIVELGSRVAWSPDGKRAAYGRGNRTPGRIYAMDLPGPTTAFQRMGGIEILDLESGRRRLVSPSGKDPAWSPDGRHLAFVREPHFNNYRREEIWLVPADGGKERKLGLGGFPSWSRDSRRVYFHSRMQNAVCFVDIEEPDPEPNKIIACPGWYPAVSPDEKLLAYATDNTVRVIDMESGRLIRFWTAPVPQGGMLVSWSPDGAEISVGGFDASLLGLWILEVETFVARKVLGGPVTLGSWSPDKKRFAFDARGAFYETWLADLSDPRGTAHSLGYSEEVQALPPPPDGAVPETPAERRRLVEVVRLLEERIRRGPRSTLLAERLSEYRRRLLPDLPTYASIDEALEVLGWEPFVPLGASWRFFRGVAEPSIGLEWTGVSFDDRQWDEGPSGFGYGDGDDATILEDMQAGYTTVYLRRHFELPEDGMLPEIRLKLRVDDGGVVFVNGNEVERVRAGSRDIAPTHDSTAMGLAPEPLETLSVPIPPGVLRPGRNVIAIQGLNESPSSSDFTLAPALEAQGTGATYETDLERFQAFRNAAAGPDASARVAYLEGRLLARHGRHLEATERLLQALEKAPGTELFAALVHSARRCDRAFEVAWRLHGFLETCRGDSESCRKLIQLWVSLCLVDPGRTPAAIRRDLPAPQSGAAGHAEDCLSDVRWLLGELSGTETLRINCGGAEFRSPEGPTWSQDRFFSGGYRYGIDDEGSSVDPFVGDILETADDPLYQTERWFERSPGRLPGYHIPLPESSYRVRLHFAEIYHSERGDRLFSVRVEGKERLHALDLLEDGFATARVESLDVEVSDGMLDLEFVHNAGDPKISAIEIEKAR